VKQDGQKEQRRAEAVDQAEHQQEAEPRIGRRLLLRPLRPTDPPIVMALPALPPLRG